MFCPNCGKANDDTAVVCSSCGTSLTDSAATVSEPVTTVTTANKSKVAAGLLGIFLGALGIHNFYLGFTKKGIIQLVISLVGAVAFGIGPILMEIWGIVEGVMYLTGSKNTDADGNLLS